MSKLKYINIEVPEIEIDEIDPLVYFSVVQCPHCQVILDSEKNLKVTGMSSGRSGFHIGTKAVANCKCPHCKTTFDVITTITSKFSVGLFVHTVLSLLSVISFIFGIISGAIYGICSLKSQENTEAKILVKTFGYLAAILGGIFLTSLLGSSALETWNEDCTHYTGIDN